MRELCLLCVPVRASEPCFAAQPFSFYDPDRVIARIEAAEARSAR